jgi:hypothetical protein
MSVGIAATNTIMMNTWNILPESYQQRVYIITSATVKGRNRQVENQLAAVVIRIEAAHVDNVIPHYRLTSNVGLHDLEIRRTDPNITTDNYCMDFKIPCGMPQGNGEYENKGDKSNQYDTIPTISGLQWAGSELERLIWEPGMQKDMGVMMVTI